MRPEHEAEQTAQPDTDAHMDDLLVADESTDSVSAAEEVDAGQVDAEEVDASDDGAPDAPTRRPLDSVSSWLLGVALALVVVLLVTGLSVVLFVFALHDAPRTNTEYQISVNQAAVQQTPSDAGAWSKLAYAYAAAKRYPLALSTAQQGRSATGNDSLLLVTADVLRLSGDNKAAIAAYDTAYTAVTAAEAAAKLKLQQENITVPLGDETLAQVYFGRALSKHALGDLAGAIDDLRHATAIAPQESNLWAQLGDYETQAGDWKGARAAYRSALMYVPDLPQAVAGLATLKKGGH